MRWEGTGAVRRTRFGQATMTEIACPLGSLSSELSDDHPWARDALAASFTAWSEAIKGITASAV